MVRPPDGWLRERGLDADTPANEWPEAYVGDGVGMNSSNDEVSLDGLPTPEAKQRIAEWLEASGAGERAVIYKLHDWLFSRQRYWGEPFPIVYDDDDNPIALPESLLPVELPEMTDFEPRILADDDPSPPEPPLARADDWVNVELDLGDGTRRYRRETNTMPQWAGSCWYYLRYLDPTNDDQLVDPALEQYWMGVGDSGGVDLYVGGAEHAVLHLLYARFWHKVLFDLGHVSTPEPFHRLVQPGHAHRVRVPRRARHVRRSERRRGARRHVPLRRAAGAPRARAAWARAARTWSRPTRSTATTAPTRCGSTRCSWDRSTPTGSWSTADIAGVYRFLQRFWRNVVDEDTGELHVSSDAADDDTRRLLHRTIDAVRADMGTLEYNTAIARLFELNNHLTQVVAEQGSAPDEVVRADGADARSAHAARRRGAVGEARSRRRRSRSSRSRCPIPRCSSTTKSRSRCR